MDLNTWIMEDLYSLQEHIFNRLDEIAYRDINVYNPLNIGPPVPKTYLDNVALSADSESSPINMILSQDCRGFNMGSFFIRRSEWTDRLLDTWWDPVLYTQMHLQWEHEEQDALEYLYANHPWIRTSIAFLPQRYINSFPPGACGEGSNPAFHYSEADRDFVVNMADCQFGRDCLGEMDQFREHSEILSHGDVPPAENYIDRIKASFRGFFGLNNS